MVGIGIAGDYVNLQPLVDEYRREAAEIFFPFPSLLGEGRKSGNVPAASHLDARWTKANTEHG
jgi:hypothetical protein